MEKNKMSKRVSAFFYFLLFTFCLSLFTSCNQLNVYEKDATIPKYEWHYDYIPSFEFTVDDTSAQYNLYIVLRHTDAYGYNNICLNVGQQYQADTMTYQRLDLELASDANGWQGTGMDDIWEVRKSITPGPVTFKKTGNYKFVVSQQMRENPLNDIMSVGIRVEKVK
jgi:gliding motility-associated lipoprotein GldH